MNNNRLTTAEVNAAIVSEHYFTAKEGVIGETWGTRKESDLHIPEALYRLTFCVLVLPNGFTVTGQSSCVDYENFDAEIGRKAAKQDAVRQVWPYLAYEMRSRITAEMAAPVIVEKLEG